MTRFRASFPALLDCFSLETLETHPSTVYGLCSDLTLNYLNPSWFLFARENSGEPAISERFVIGTHIGDAIAGAAGDFYLERFQRVIDTGEVWHHDYECSSADLFRLYHQTAYPLHNRDGIVIVNSLTLEHPHDTVSRVPHGLVEALYLRDDGFITQCSNCRRVQREASPSVWDWVPRLVAETPEYVSHSFCPVCFDYYFATRYAPRGRN